MIKKNKYHRLSFDLLPHDLYFVSFISILL